MDELPESLLLRILSHLDDSADVARCRVASKAFDDVFPGLRSINLRCSDCYSTKLLKPFKPAFLHHISKLETVESVSLVLNSPVSHPSQKLYLTDNHFTNAWLPRVSASLKSLTIRERYSQNPSDILPMISASCHNLVNLKLKDVRLSVNNMNPMPMLTSLTLDLAKLEQEPLNDFNKCFPNLQFLQLELASVGSKHPKIHLLNLKTCLLDVHTSMESLTLIAPKLIKLKFGCYNPRSLHVEAPVLSHFHISFCKHGPLTLNMFENLKTLWLESSYCGSLVSAFPHIKTVENLTLESSDGNKWERDPRYPNLTLRKVFIVFPNVSSLCIRSGAWSELIKACLNPQGCEILDGMKGLKTICVYLRLDDPLLTFAFIACVLDQCVDLLEVELLINKGDIGSVSESFMSKYMARWPGLKWRWGIWEDLVNHGTSS